MKFKLTYISIKFNFEFLVQVSDDGTASVGAVKVFDFGVNFDLETYVKAVQMTKQQKFVALFGNGPQAAAPVAPDHQTA